MGGGSPAGRAGAAGAVQQVRRREPATGGAARTGEPRTPGAAGPRPS